MGVVKNGRGWMRFDNTDFTPLFSGATHVRGVLFQNVSTGSEATLGLKSGGDTVIQVKLPSGGGNGLTQSKYVSFGSPGLKMTDLDVSGLISGASIIVFHDRQGR